MTEGKGAEPPPNIAPRRLGARPGLKRWQVVVSRLLVLCGVLLIAYDVIALKGPRPDLLGIALWVILYNLANALKLERPALKAVLSIAGTVCIVVGIALKIS